MANELNPNASLDDLLDGTLDDLADVPVFEPFRRGAHKVKIEWKITEVNKIPSIQLNMTLVEHMELVNPEDKPQEPGAGTNVLFMLKKEEDGKLVRNDLAEGQWKEILASLRTGLNLDAATTNRAVMEATNGLEVMAVTDIRENKKDKDNIKYYTAVKSIVVI